MKLKSQNILFICRGTQHGGTENVVLQLCEILKPQVNKIVVCSSDGFHVSALSKLEIRHYKIPDIEQKSPRTVFITASIIKKIIKQEKITIIHTHHRMAAFYISFLQLYKKCIFINTSHNTFKNKRYLTRFSYKHGHLVACGEMVKKNLVNYFELPPDKITIIHNAVKPFNGNVIQDDLIKEMHKQGFFVVGNIGRLTKQKGMEYFINAMPDVIKKHKKIRFVIVGSGEDEQKLNELVKKRMVNEYVTFLGYRNDIQNLMSQLDLIVLSSLWEGLPLTPIEAFSVGKTIVATDVDGTGEIVQDGVNGCLISPYKSELIAEKICFLIDNPSIKINYEKRAIERYKKEFLLDKFAESYIEYYERYNIIENNLLSKMLEKKEKLVK